MIAGFSLRYTLSRHTDQYWNVFRYVGTITARMARQHKTQHKTLLTWSSRPVLPSAPLRTTRFRRRGLNHSGQRPRAPPGHHGKYRFPGYQRQELFGLHPRDSTVAFVLDSEERRA